MASKEVPYGITYRSNFLLHDWISGVLSEKKSEVRHFGRHLSAGRDGERYLGTGSVLAGVVRSAQGLVGGEYSPVLHHSSLPSPTPLPHTSSADLLVHPRILLADRPCCGSRIKGSKRHRIRDPDQQHC